MTTPQEVLRRNAARRSASILAAAALAALAVGSSAPAQAQVLGPSPYTSFSNSPFSSLTFSTYFNLENFEDSLLNVPGVTASAGGPFAPGGITDSVDADDGTIDGFGTAGRSFFSGSGPAGISFTFNAAVLGTLPTHAGIVWTDGAGSTTFSAFDVANNLIGTFTATHADGTFTGTTGEDRFYGMIAPGGIARIFISNASGGIEVDHLQYGAGVSTSNAAPEPATLALFGLGLTAFAGRRLRRRRA